MCALLRQVKEKKAIDLPLFPHVLDSTGFGEVEEVFSWGQGELEPGLRPWRQGRANKYHQAWVFLSV